MREVSFARVLTSPRRRAARTCDLAGFPSAGVDDDLAEWNYGLYEGKTTAQIRQEHPGWEIFRDGCPDGETVVEVAARAVRVIERLRALDGNTLLFSHNHFLRVFAACWLGLDPATGRCFLLGTAALSSVGYQHGLDDPVVRLWNDCAHQRE